MQVNTPAKARPYEFCWFDEVAPWNTEDLLRMRRIVEGKS
jgi:hypothetical protein